jgi:Eukaryotic translation initiation factor 3 subunit G
LANQGLKPKTSGGQFSSTFATTLDATDNKKKYKKDSKKKDSKNLETEKNGIKKDIKCYKCGENHYASQCPNKKKVLEKEDSDSEKNEEEDRNVHATWHASTFTTYQVNAIGYSGFSQSEVLLDNQADISVMKPGLLRAFEDLASPVKVSGVGGIQLTVKQT